MDRAPSFGPACRALPKAAVRALVLTLLLSAHAPMARADFSAVTSRGAFLDSITDRHLTRTGIKLNVSANGAINGRAFGRPVTGQWRWQDGYFCRDLSWGTQALEFNCQLVERDGNRLRFTSDRGTGQSAVLKLQ